MIGIIDYGMGNLYSVKNAFLSLGAKAEIIDKPNQLLEMSKAVLPGVGAFGDAMDILSKSGLSKSIKEFVQTQRPFLGICLGLQLLFEKSSESPGKKGLCLLKGKVEKFKGKIKIPHIGWNRIIIKKQTDLLSGVSRNSFFYFCHSYYVKPQDKNVISCVTDYGINFTSIVASGNIFGIQFHPEKSQSSGLKILENFAKL